MSGQAIIAKRPPQDGQEWDCQCARCGSSVYFEDCDACGGEGITGPGELYEQDPLWYDEDDFEDCPTCGGQAAWGICCSGAEWCESNPMDGRAEVERGKLEWFIIPARQPLPDPPKESQ